MGMEGDGRKADVNVQEPCNRVHFDDGVKNSGLGGQSLVFCVE
jgi:hypothetical protein